MQLPPSNTFYVMLRNSISITYISRHTKFAVQNYFINVKRLFLIKNISDNQKFLLLYLARRIQQSISKLHYHDFVKKSLVCLFDMVFIVKKTRLVKKTNLETSVFVVSELVVESGEQMIDFESFFMFLNLNSGLALFLNIWLFS